MFTTGAFMEESAGMSAVRAGMRFWGVPKSDAHVPCQLGVPRTAVAPPLLHVVHAPYQHPSHVVSVLPPRVRPHCRAPDTPDRRPMHGLDSCARRTPRQTSWATPPAMCRTC